MRPVKCIHCGFEYYDGEQHICSVDSPAVIEKPRKDDEKSDQKGPHNSD